MKTLQDRLRVELNRRGRGAISELARYVGVKPQTARTWVREGVSPKEPNIEKIAEYLKVSPHWLRYGDAVAPPPPPPQPPPEPVLEYLIEDEHQLIQNYRRCTQEGRDQILTASRVAEKMPMAELLRRRRTSNN
jgi:transcriptional regulator with XRE-family HTH domain